MLNLTEDEKARICKAEGGTAYLEPSFQLRTEGQFKEKRKGVRQSIKEIVLEKTSSDARKVTEEDFDSQIMKSTKDPRQESQPSI